MTGLAIGLAFLTSFALGYAAVVTWAGIAALLLVRRSASGWASIAIVAVAVFGAYWATSHHGHDGEMLTSGGFEGVGRVVAGPFHTRSGQQLTIRGESTGNLPVCVYTDVAARPHVGDLVFVAGQLSQPRDLSRIGQASLVARDCAARLSANNVIVVLPGKGVLARLSHVRTDLSAFLMRAAPGDTGTLLSGLVTGDDGALSNSAYQAFLESGTTHITAISGANFAVLVLLLGIALSGSMRRSAGFVAAATTMIWLYAVMVGLQPSALRAALLATAVLVGRWIGRTPDLLTLTLLLASIQVVVRPNDFDTLAFQLSLAATLALILVFDGSERIGRHWFEALVLCVIAAQLATIPVLAARIGTLNGTGLRASLLVGPLASLVFPAALIGGLLGQVMPSIGEAALYPAIVGGQLIVAIVNWCAELLPGNVQLGSPVPAAIATLTLVCWGVIFALSGDLRRMGRHGWEVAKSW